MPLPTGAYKVVGCRDFMVGYNRRSGVLLRLYYPAAEQKRRIQEQYLQWPNWLPHENYRQGYGEVGGIRWPPMLKLLSRLVGEAFLPVVPNAKPLRRREPFPVIVFSHGLGGCRSTYSAICLELVSHGFVVAGRSMSNN